jgi:hypothetical protein
MDWKNAETRRAWEFLTNEKYPDRLEPIRRRVELIWDKLFAGKVSLVSEEVITAGPDGTGESRVVPAEAMTLSRAARGILASVLDNNFGADAPEDVYDLDTLAGHMAFAAALQVDWQQLADRLLRKLTLDYVPGDATAGDAA